MRRRDFLNSAMGLAIAQILTGCADNSNAFRVELVKGLLPGQLLGRLQTNWKQPNKLEISPLARVQDAFTRLQNWQFRQQLPNQPGMGNWVRELPIIGQPATKIADTISLPDYWLQAAIQQNLIEPIDTSKLTQWASLEQKWQKLVTRDNQGLVSDGGKVWGAPFRWGTTVIVYRRDLFRQNGWNPPQDWDDLWREELRSRISLLDHPRETIGLVLKKLGKSYNTEIQDLSSIANLKSELLQLHRQAKFYSSDRYLEPLIIGDTYMAVGWSNEVIPLILKQPRLGAIIPKSGTALWADLWVIPARKTQALSPSIAEERRQWIDFFWEEQNARQITLGSKANTPISASISPQQIQPSIQDLLIPSQSITDKSEFILPLSSSLTQHYFEFFNQIKQE